MLVGVGVCHHFGRFYDVVPLEFCEAADGGCCGLLFADVFAFLADLADWVCR